MILITVGMMKVMSAAMMMKFRADFIIESSDFVVMGSGPLCV